MSEPERYRGLCLTCRNAASCTFPRDPDTPVLRCEEFVSIEPPAAARPGHGAPTSPSDGGDAGDARILGLCRTCTGRHTCTLPKPEGGVWDCEEYQ